MNSSLKELIQSMLTESTNIILGVVTSENPLKIEGLNDEKLKLNQNMLCLPRYLTRYENSATIETVEIKENGANGFNSISNVKITVDNSLKIGEIVYLLSFNQGKRYYILDREVNI